MINPSSGTCGNGEIRLKAADGTIFVAPVLIHHYIAAHGYIPPSQFIEAVQTGESITSIDDGS